MLTFGPSPVVCGWLFISAGTAVLHGGEESLYLLSFRHIASLRHHTANLLRQILKTFERSGHVPAGRPLSSRKSDMVNLIQARQLEN